MDPNTAASFCCVADFKEFALRSLPKNVVDYYCTGSGQENTIRNNRTAFDKLRIRPRILVDAPGKVDISTEVLGCPLQIPFGIAPSAMQKLAHPDGEIGNAKAIGKLGGVYIHSTISTTSVEEVASAAPDTIKWFQIYFLKDRELTKRVVQKAEKVGYRALVFTADANVMGLRYAVMKNPTELPPHLKLGNFDWSVPEIDTLGLDSYLNQLLDHNISWKDIKWLKEITKLPIIIKGILTAEDALLAIDHGVSAIIVSNHGGRQLDSAPASIEALREIVKVVGDKIDIFFDGGVEFGMDIFKALALGAKMVFLGKSALWGLTCGGEKGIQKLLEILQHELVTTMGLTGCQNLKAIKKNMVVHESYYDTL
ncbi:uncharacterized protein LOC135837708 [Planococcus citri]|uniref:uncharacterized protein LOC135837708 n=1 Tax=Planococcus citri TaxID=170843 RepID=UPI0031F8000B